MIAALAFALAGCAVTDTGNPPLGPVIDPTDIDATFLAGGIASVSGPPGAIDPPEGTLRMTNLDTMREPVDASVAADGSFSGSIFVEVGEIVRLQVLGEPRSAPVDLESSGWTVIVPSLPCVTVAPFVAIETAGEVTVANECAESVTATIALRSEPSVLTVAPAELTVAPGTTERFDIDVSSIASEVEEIVFVTASAGAAVDRRAVTVLARP